MKRIAVFISGGGSNLQSLIDSIESGYIKNAQIVCVITNKSDAYGLKRVKKHNIETLVIENKNINSKKYTQKLVDETKKRNIDIICLAGFMVILDSIIVKEYRNKILNIHPALLPCFGGKGLYGHYVHNAVYNAGVKVTGATVHFVDDGCDTGPIILQESIKIDDFDTPKTIASKVLDLEHKIYPKALKLVVTEKLKIEPPKRVIQI